VSAEAREERDRVDQDEIASERREEQSAQPTAEPKGKGDNERRENGASVQGQER
jgi:hypothetical protein